MLFLIRFGWIGFLSQFLEPWKERGEHYQGQQRGGDEAADHDDRQGTLHLRADPVSKRERDQTQQGDQSGHQHRTETQ